MTEPIPSAGETTIIGLPAITIPVTSTGDRPLTQEDLDTIARLSEGTALLISTRGAVSGSRYLLDEDKVTVGRDSRADILLDDSTVSGVHPSQWRLHRGGFRKPERHLCEPPARRARAAEEWRRDHDRQVPAGLLHQIRRYLLDLVRSDGLDWLQDT